METLPQHKPASGKMTFKISRPARREPSVPRLNLDRQPCHRRADPQLQERHATGPVTRVPSCQNSSLRTLGWCKFSASLDAARILPPCTCRPMRSRVVRLHVRWPHVRSRLFARPEATRTAHIARARPSRLSRCSGCERDFLRCFGAAIGAPREHTRCILAALDAL